MRYLSACQRGWASLISWLCPWPPSSNIAPGPELSISGHFEVSPNRTTVNMSGFRRKETSKRESWTTRWLAWTIISSILKRNIPKMFPVIKAEESWWQHIRSLIGNLRTPVKPNRYFSLERDMLVWSQRIEFYNGRWVVNRIEDLSLG